MDTPEPIVVTVIVTKHGHSTRLKSAAITEGPPHVKTFIDCSSFESAMRGLALNGYDFTVRTVYDEVSLLDWIATEPFCDGTCNAHGAHA